MKDARAPRSWLWLQGVMVGVVAATAPGSALLVAVLLCPAVAYAVFETTPGRPVTRTMLSCGSIGTFMPLRLLWEHGNSVDEALALLADLTRPLLAWVACATGWLLSEASHMGARVVLKAAFNRRSVLLQREEADLTAEWTLQDSDETSAATAAERR